MANYSRPYMPMFSATLTKFYRATNLTKGKTYTVVDFNDYMGTYIILDDNGDRCALNWMNFADQGHASTEYQKEA